MRSGRPRAFCLDAAIASAMPVFWRKGYEGASIADLTEAIGINPPSLYAAFGSKEGLFRAVIDRYEQERKDDLDKILSAASARATAELYLAKVAEGATSTDGKHPPGCLIVQSSQGCGDDAIPAMAARLRAAKEQALRERFERARKEGDLPKSADAAALARFIMTVANGMFMQATAGATEKELREVARLALLAWPTDANPRRTGRPGTKRSMPAQ
jgi:AcrR family transcriptional regulator